MGNQGLWLLTEGGLSESRGLGGVYGLQIVVIPFNLLIQYCRELPIAVGRTAFSRDHKCLWDAFIIPIQQY